MQNVDRAANSRTIWRLGPRIRVFYGNSPEKREFTLPVAPDRLLRHASRARSWCCGRVWAQEDREYRAGAGGAFDIEKSAVTIEDVLDDRKSEPGAAQFARARRVDAVEALGQPR